jgi:DNA modification methylase
LQVAGEFGVNYLNQCHFGDVRAVLRQMIADGVKVNTIVTSPPYWGLRSYLPADHPDKVNELGSEPTIQEFIGSMTEVFMLAREVLADDGTLFLNMGDCYATGAGKVNTAPGGGTQGERWAGVRGDDKLPGIGPMTQPNRMPQPSLKPKDLVGQPWRLAFALQDGTRRCNGCGVVQASSDWPIYSGHRVCVACLMEGRTEAKVLPDSPGWWLRQDIIWSKPNPMPESVTDRCTKSHEYIFLLSKSERYYFDQGAILEPVSANTHARLSQDVQNQIGSTRANGGAKTNGNMKAVARGVGWGHGTDAKQRNRGRVKNNESFDEAMAIMPSTRNKRSVWSVVTESYKGAHFATFPCALIEPCILAGAPAGGTVLDIFMGSGTTAQVAERLGRQWIGIDIDVRNKTLQDERLRQPSLNLEAA